MFTTPILLITFNRPDHVRQVLTEVRKQQPTQLFVCQDGAREGNLLDCKRVQEVRNVINELVDWPCELHTLYHKKNLGCGPGPVAGITWFFEHVEFGIIIEDDAVPHPEFFEYAAILLEKYKDDESVRAIGSVKLYNEQFVGGSYYFSMMNRILCAWATWSRAWNYFDYEMKQYSVKDLNRAMKQYGATLREREYWQERLEEIHVDCLGNSSWDQQFWMTIWLTGGKGICPNSNLSTNIGFDDLGTHTTDPNNVGSCRPLEPILPLIEPTDTSVQRKADLLFHKTYYAPWEYGWSGFKRIPHRLNTRVKRFLGYKGSWRKIFSKKMLTICLFALFFSNALALNVVFRFDDPRLVEDPITLRVLQLFEERECPITLAIIAADTIESPVMPTTINDSLYVSKLNSANVEIALHGLTHKDINGCGEFGLVDYNEAYRKIYKGKYLLGNYINDDIITFIPPYNAINNSTLCAMVENQLFILSADMTSEVYVEGIQFYPETLGDLIRTNGLWNAAKFAILHCNTDDAICVIMFHAYDLQNEDSWNKLVALLDYCQSDKNIKLHTFSSLYESGNSSSFYRIKANQLRSLLRKYVLNYGVLYPTWLCWLVHIINALLHSAIPFLILIGLRKNNATYVWGIILITSIAYFMFAYFQLITPLKLLFGCLVLVLIITSIILICNYSKK